MMLRRPALVAFCVMLLSACGGGGSTGTTGGSSATPPPAVTPGNLLMTMPANPYPVGSPEYINFNEINRVRIAGGFGAMLDDPVMRKSANAHLQYGLLNADYYKTHFDAGPHTEQPGLPGFTGVDPQARCLAAALGTAEAGQISCGENILGLGAPVAQTNVVGGFTAAVGHLQNQLDYRGNRMGMATSDFPTETPTLSASGGVIDLGSIDGARPQLASDQVHAIVGIHPYPGQTGVGIGAATTTYVLGTTILIQTSDGDLNPTVTTFSLRKFGATTDWPARQIAAGEAAYGPGSEPTLSGWAILMPTAMLEPNTTYTVTFKGSIGGAPLSKTWSFTTGTEADTRIGG